MLQCFDFEVTIVPRLMVGLMLSMMSAKFGAGPGGAVALANE